MATLVLQAAGAAIGGIFGPVGAIIGRALGGLAGYAVDQSLFGASRTVVGGRLADLDVQASREGTSIPRVYGRVRIAGQMIWATRFEETVSDDREGGKGSGGTTTVRTYSYFANFAIGLCEGPITRIGRVWADGKPFDLSSVTCRIYTGTDDQDADSLILAKQGEGAPAYRGTAYVVFERMPLEDFGNRIPQLSFEVMRAVGGVEDKVRAITLIPGSTEFGYDPEPVRQEINPGETRTVNRHVDSAATDWHAALDDLQAVCPNLESVGLVVSWFGDDLRAGACTLKPGVADGEGETTPEWNAAGLSRSAARVVSRFEGKPAYGGTPSDASVVRAIRDLTDRGLKVMFHPFVMMDVPAGNGLPDPYGGTSQGAYPWRGTLTASVAPGLPGSPDKTTAAAAEIAAFVGSAAPDDFEIAGDAVVYSGPEEWSFRRLVLHNAWLCKAAGGVDAFLIGSELRGLTTLRSSASHYPFVAALVALAEDVRAVLGPSTKISYAADWSEYFGHQPRDGSGDVFFHLDPLWASDAIDFVGIDNYMPLADWRDGDDHLDAALWDSIRERAYLRANIAAGEGYDWYYASFADREAQVRTAIADGAYGKPWIFRYKDLVGWWSNAHHNRPGGVESVAATEWVPQSKPIRFTEIGCPAVDKGPNQPNVFPDPKSVAGAIPNFSTGLREDLVQRRFLEATLGYWDPDDSDFDPAANPASGIYDGRMVDHAATHLWTWDARPFPVFPYREDVWSDGPNWDTGHWLNGRLGALSADALVAAIAADYGVAEADVGDLDGVIDGYVIPQVTSARRALEPLAEILMFDAVESGSAIRFLRRGRRSRMSFGGEDLAEEGDRPLVSIRRAQETELPAELSIGFADTLADYRPTSVSSRRLATGSHRTDATETGATLTHSVATGLADTLLQDVWAGRETISFALTGKALSLEPADICDLDLADGSRTILVTRIEDAGLRRVEARTIEPDILAPVPSSPRIVDPQVPATLSAPEILLLDLPLLTGSEPGYAPRVAAFAEPWPGAVAIAIGTPETGYLARQVLPRRATVGVLTAPLASGPLGRWDHANEIEVRLYAGALASEPRLAVLNGANAAAIGSAATGYEVVQFETATLVGDRRWRLRGLLRGQAGTMDIGDAGHASGVNFVMLDGAVPPLTVSETESWLALTLRCGRAGAIYDPDLFTDLPLVVARRGLRCLPPVHPRVVHDSGNASISWIRQTRIGGDPWEPAEVPIGETVEAYTVAILDGASVVRTLAAEGVAATYSAADQIADFGSVQSEFQVRITQVSPTEGPGVPMEALLHA
jgi:hypothetical protein